MNVMLVDSIFVGERQRRDIEATEKHIKDLREDIKLNGLIHAPSVSLNGDLIVGWCRLQAVKGLEVDYKYGQETIPAGHIPVNILAALDERVLFRIELAENLRRRNLSPADEARAVSALHKMFTDETPGLTRAEVGEKIQELRGGPERDPSSNAAEVADSLLINAFADDPDVKRAATRREALRTVKKKLEEQFQSGLGSVVIPKASDFHLLEGKLEDIMPQLPNHIFHGIIADPPYGVDADKFGEQSTATGHQYVDSKQHALDIAQRILDLGWRVCRDDAHLYMFCDIRLWPNLKILAEDAGWKPFATPLIWHKPGLGHAPQPGYFGRRYETILFAQKGNRKLSKSASDVFQCSSVKDKMYAAQKPVELLQAILDISFFAGEHILDPCCGSGSLFRAAKAGKYKVTGIEPNAMAIGLAKLAMSEG